MGDRISTLPDEILCHILSFLPTQNAVATSLLSKKWKPLWRSVPGLYFDDGTYLTNNKPYHFFPKFVYATILAKGAHRPITSFRLHCRASNFDLHDSDLSVWASAATQRGGLENLHIRMPIGKRLLSLSSCIVSCKTLVVLKLRVVYFDAFSFVDLPSLKTLHLRNVGFTEPQCLLELVSGCPILEYMQLKQIFYREDSTSSYKNFKILSKLVWADIYEIDLFIPLKAISNVKFLRIEQFVPDIPVFLNLTHVELMWCWHMNLSLVLAIVKQCPKLQNFSLHMMKTSGRFIWISPSFVPECLSSQLRKCSITNYAGTKFELNFAKYIMQNSGVLQTMTICTEPFSKLEEKYEMLKELSLFPRICELVFK